MVKVMYQWLMRDRSGETFLTGYYESIEDMDRCDPSLRNDNEIVVRVDETAITDKDKIAAILKRRQRGAWTRV